MDRRTMFASAGAAAIAGTVASKAFSQENATASHPKHTMNAAHQACLEACQSCESTCNAMISHCLTHASEGHKEHVSSARAAITCQDFCGLSAKLIARMDSLAMANCEVCAKACDACAAECEKMPSDKQMAACAKECRACAALCRKMTA